MIVKVVIDLLIKMIVRIVIIVSGLCRSMVGLNNMLIEMKNRMVKVFCRGSEFVVV